MSHLAKFLSKPVFTATPLQLQRVAAQKPVSFRVKIASLIPNSPEPSVRMILQVGAEETREFDMKQVDGVFTATAIPVRKGAGDRLEVSIRYNTGLLAGSVKDTGFKVGNNMLQLGAVRKIQFKPKPLVLLADGRTTQEGEITGLKDLEVTFGGNTLKADLAQAIQVLVNAPPGTDRNQRDVRRQRGQEGNRPIQSGYSDSGYRPLSRPPSSSPRRT